MIYLIISVLFAVSVSVISLELLIKNKLRKTDEKMQQIHLFLHLLNSIAVLIVAFLSFKSGNF